MGSSSCFNLAIMYKNGNGVEKDDFKSSWFFIQKFVKWIHQKACYNLGLCILKVIFSYKIKKNKKSILNPSW